MQQALPYRSWQPAPIDSPIADYQSESIFNKIGNTSKGELSNRRSVKDMVLENAVVLFGKRGCCMCHAMKRLLLMLGVNPVVYEVEEEDEGVVINELLSINREGAKDGRLQFPSVFIGGKLFGGLDRLMAAHISGELIPILKKAGALWL